MTWTLFIQTGSFSSVSSLVSVMNKLHKVEFLKNTCDVMQVHRYLLYMV